MEVEVAGEVAVEVEDSSDLASEEAAAVDAFAAGCEAGVAEMMVVVCLFVIALAALAVLHMHLHLHGTEAEVVLKEAAEEERKLPLEAADDLKKVEAAGYFVREMIVLVPLGLVFVMILAGPAAMAVVD